MLDRICVIAVCGKGGVGKTSISAMIIRQLLQSPESKVLAIDADPAVGLASALGMIASRTVDDIRNDLICRMGNGQVTDKVETLAMLDYDMVSALEESKNLAFLAIGRPEKEGCYCQVNHLLKEIICAMAESFDFVVIDGEAGIEQVNRRVMANVTHLVLVSNGSVKGFNVVKTIKAVADNAISFKYAGLVVNRVREEEIAELRLPPELLHAGWIPEDDVIRKADMAGEVF